MTDVREKLTELLRDKFGARTGWAWPDVADAILAAHPELTPPSGNEAAEAARRVFGGTEPYTHEDVHRMARYILSLAPGKDVVEGARDVVRQYHNPNTVIGDEWLASLIAAFATACVAKETERHRAEVSNLTKQRDDWHAAADDWADKANELRADADAGREFMRAAWQEFNAIRARDGAPSGVSEAWWSELTDALDKLLGNDTVPWMLGAAKELVSPYATRAEKAEAEVERLTRERDETLAAVRATMSRLMDERDAAESALAAAQKRCGELEELARDVAHDDGTRDTVSEHNAFPFFSKLNQRMCLLRDKAIAALAGKESGNGDETVRPNQQEKDG